MEFLLSYLRVCLVFPGRKEKVGFEVFEAGLGSECMNKVTLEHTREFRHWSNGQGRYGLCWTAHHVPLYFRPDLKNESKCESLDSFLFNYNIISYQLGMHPH